MNQEENTPIENDEATKSKKENFKHTLCYIPFVAPVLFFVEENKSPELKKHINYGIILFVWYVLLNMIPFLHIGWFLFVFYVGISAVLAYKAYSWEKVDIEYFDKIEQKIKDKM